MSINVSKTKSMTFRRQAQFSAPILTLNGVPVENVDSSVLYSKEVQSDGTVIAQKT